MSGRQNTVEILGARVDALSKDELYSRVRELVLKPQKSIVTYVNVHTLNLAAIYPGVKKIYSQSSLNYCDGAGVVLGAQLLGQRLPGRLTSATFIYPLCEKWAEDGTTLFLLGGKEGVAQKAAENLSALFPRLKIVGHEHGYFKRNHEQETLVLQKINQVQPDILFVGFGTPFQENWVLRNFEQIDANVIWPIGAMVDFVSGAVARCPDWMQKNSLEWLYRFYLEPRRLFNRYAVGNSVFLLRVLLERLTKR